MPRPLHKSDKNSEKKMLFPSFALPMASLFGSFALKLTRLVNMRLSRPHLEIVWRMILLRDANSAEIFLR